MADRVTAYREQAVLLGPTRSLVGILCAPTTAPPPGAATVVILNSGIIHRVGANRLHVQVARTLASMGVPVVRFDLSGIGDSPPRTDLLPVLDGVMADIRSVLDHLSAVRGDASFVLMGLCSGAMHAILYGADDPRVDGLVLLDLLIPRTTGYWLRRVRRRLFVPMTWRNVLTGRTRLWRRAASARDGSAVAVNDETYPAHLIRDALDARFRATIARGVPTLAIFTGGLEGQHNYRHQLLHALPGVDFGDRLQLEYFADSDHTFSNAATRQAMIDLVARWFHTAKRPIRPAANGDTAAETPATSGSASEEREDREDLAF
ncbi:MAG: alpha/beta fold hydrolase [Gemmatimonadales bacterium]